MELPIYVTLRLCDLEQQVQHHLARDPIEAVGKLAQAVAVVDRVWTDWVLSIGGQSVGLVGNTHFSVIGADHLDELEVRYEQIEAYMDTEDVHVVAVGVGRHPHDSHRAMEAAEKDGGGIRLYDDKVKEDLAEEDELSKTMVFDYGQPLAKADPELMVGDENQPLEDQPGEEAPRDHMTEFAALRHHSQQVKLGDQQAQMAQQQANAVKAQIAQTIQEFRQQAPLLEELKGQAPDLYRTLLQVVQSMITMAQETYKPQPMQKAVDERLLAKGLSAGFRHRVTGEIYDTGTIHDLNTLEDLGVPLEDVEEGFVQNGKFLTRKQAYQAATGRPIAPPGALLHGDYPELESQDYLYGGVPGQVSEDRETVAKAEPAVPGMCTTPEEFLPKWKGMGVGAARDKFLIAHANYAPFLQAVESHPLKDRLKQLLDREITRIQSPAGMAAAGSKLMAKALEHAKEAGKTGRHNTILPVGSQVDMGPSSRVGGKAGHVKVRSKAKSKWRQVWNNMVMAPDGTPTSSLNPDGDVEESYVKVNPSSGQYEKIMPPKQ